MPIPASGCLRIHEPAPGWRHQSVFARFAYGSGWRKGEVATLEWSAIDRDGTCVTLRRERSVAMRVTGHQTISVFQRYRIVSDDDVRAALGKVQGHNPGHKVVDDGSRSAGGVA